MNSQQKIKEVMRKTGCDVQDACSALGIDCDASVMASMADSGEKITVQEIIENGKISAARVLIDIIEDNTAENKDRIAAAKIVLVGSGDLPQLGLNGFEERFKKFQELSNQYASKVIDIIDISTDRQERSNNRLLSIAS